MRFWGKAARSCKVFFIAVLFPSLKYAHFYPRGSRLMLCMRTKLQAPSNRVRTLILKAEGFLQWDDMGERT